MSTQRITIFVHGTLPPEPLLHIPLARNFFFCPSGLTKANDLDDKFTMRRIANQLHASDPESFHLDHFYLFGWSGSLLLNERRKAARDLHNHLLDLVSKHTSSDKSPSLCLITHSHGGNVALLLKDIVEETEQHIIIDELIALACPVQTHTASSLTSPVYKKIYSIHSHHDMLQVLDPQGVHSFLKLLKIHGLDFTISHLKEIGPLFSERHFENVDHLLQLNVRHAHRELFHIEFLLPNFIATLPALVKQLREHKKIAGDHPDDLTYTLGN